MNDDLTTFNEKIFELSVIKGHHGKGRFAQHGHVSFARLLKKTNLELMIFIEQFICNLSKN